MNRRAFLRLLGGAPVAALAVRSGGLSSPSKFGSAGALFDGSGGDLPLPAGLDFGKRTTVAFGPGLHFYDRELRGARTIEVGPYPPISAADLAGWNKYFQDRGSE